MFTKYFIMCGSKATCINILRGALKHISMDPWNLDFKKLPREVFWHPACENPRLLSAQVVALPESPEHQSNVSCL